MSTEPFVSYAQNAEDVVLSRALGHLASGRYLEIGANDPTVDSISRSFYDRGWSGITVEPLPTLIEAHRRERPRDTQVHAVAGRPGSDHATLHRIAGTGLSTTVDTVRDMHQDAGYRTEEVEVALVTVDQILERHPGELHFVVIDTEGSEADVLAGFDLRRWRPWVLVVEATVPNSNVPAHEAWEADVLAAGYRFCLFDGLSRFYVAEEHAEALAGPLGFPANTLDHWITHREVELGELAEALTRDLVRWRAAVLTRWADAVAATAPAPVANAAEVAALRRELEATRSTVSWRVTAPLRTVRRRLP